MGGPSANIKCGMEKVEYPMWNRKGRNDWRRMEREKRVLLWWGVLDKLNPFFDVALQALDASLEEGLLLLGDATEDVGGLLGAVGLYSLCQRCFPGTTIRDQFGSTYAKLNRGGEEVNAGRLGDFLAAGDTGQVDVGGLDDALLALGGLDHSLSESMRGQ